MLEKMCEGKILSPEPYIWTRTFMGSIKGLLMVSVFVINGLANDFFMGLFFFFTTIIGLIFFCMNPCTDPLDDSVTISSPQQMIEKPLYQIQFKIRKELYTKVFGEAYRICCVLTILSFFILIILYLNSPSFPVAILDIRVEQPEFEVTSLAITSIIMLIYNFFAWVSFNQNISKQPKFNGVFSEMDRARLLMSQLDEVSSFCSTVK